MEDLNKPEIYIMISLAFLIMIFGIYPEPLLNTINVTISNLIENYQINLNYHLTKIIN